MKVTILICDSKNEIIYEKDREMDFIPNIGEGILLDLDEEGGWVNDNYFCTYAVCYEKYQIFGSGKTKYFVCRFLGEDFSNL